MTGFKDHEDFVYAKCTGSVHHSPTDYLLANMFAVFLFMDTNPSSPYWELALGQWVSPIGSVVLVRADGKPLTKEVAEALCGFCRYELQPMFQKCNRDEDVNGDPEGIFEESDENLTQLQRARVEMLAQLTPQHFHNYMERTKMEREGPESTN